MNEDFIAASVSQTKRSAADMMAALGEQEALLKCQAQRLAIPRAAYIGGMKNPRLSHLISQPGALVVSWRTNAAGFVLQRNNDLNATNCVEVTNVTTVVGTNQQISISLTGSGGFFRLLRP